MTDFNQYKEKKRQEKLNNIKAIDNADYEAVEREEERIIREYMDVPEKDNKINYDFCREYDRKEYEKFQEAADRLMDEVMKDPDAFLD